MLPERKVGRAMAEQIKAFQQYKVIYDARHEKPWIVVRIADGAIKSAHFKEEAARGVCRILNLRNVPMGIRVKHVATGRQATFIGASKAQAFVWLGSDVAPYVDAWGLSSVELV